MPIKLNTKAELNNEERDILDRVFDEYYKKVRRELKKDVNVNIHLRVHEKDTRGKTGKRRYDVELRISEGIVFNIKTDDFDLAIAVRSAFDKVLSEIEHKLHVSEQR